MLSGGPQINSLHSKCYWPLGILIPEENSCATSSTHVAMKCRAVNRSTKLKKLSVVAASSKKWVGQKVIYISELWQEHWGTALMI
jgi:hypothetical protein